MKKVSILFTIVLIVFHAKAQFLDSALRYRMITPSFNERVDTLISQARAANPFDTAEGGKVNSLTRWQDLVSPRISNDVPLGADMLAPYGYGAFSYLSSISSYCTGTGFQGNWQCLGPFNNFYGEVQQLQGRINSLWVDPNDSNTILAGSDAGGLWKSTNDGHSWHNLTDNGGTLPGMIGINWIAVDPLNTNIIYIAMGMTGQYSKDEYGYNLGVAYTTDGGSSWHVDTNYDHIADIPYYNAHSFVNYTAPCNKIAFLPGTEQLYAITNGSVFYKPNPTTNWSDISPWYSGSRWLYDLEFSKLPPVKALITAWSSDSTEMWIDNAGTWIDKKMQIPSTAPIMFSVSANDTAYIWFKNSYGTISKLVKTSINDINLSTINDTFNTENNDYGIQTFAVSPNNPNVFYSVVYRGDNALCHCTNGGVNFGAMAGNDHVDGRCLYIWKSSINPDSDVVYFGCDGGVGKKRMGHNFTESITGDSLAITEFYGLGNTEADEGVVVAGAQDNGPFLYKKNRTVPWVNGQFTSGSQFDCYTSKMMPDKLSGAIGGCNSTIDFHTTPDTVYLRLFTWLYPSDSFHVTQIATPYDFSSTNRPIHIANNDVASVGYRHIWQKMPDSANWHRPFLRDPVDTSGYAFPKQVVDFYIDENNGNNVYIAYKGSVDYLGSHHNPANDTFGKLYYSHNALGASPFWTNITPLADTTDCINSVAVDPQHSNRIWVALGNINNGFVGLSPAAMQSRVLYSNNSGLTWSDVSTGLSALPVNKLLYRKGSNDELFAATDVGVFKWNPTTSSWQCFNTGLPPCVVMDMEFNYCAGKLRIATYGRGIWETPLDTITIQPDTSTTIITTPTVWNTNKYLENSVVVMSGAILTIMNDTIHMPKNGSITVEPGAHIIVNNAEITNSCSSCFWQGIIVKGNNVAQTPANQGWVTLGGSTLQHAITAVSNNSGGGGIIQARYTTFLNNHTSFDLENYHGTFAGAGDTIPNLSFCYACTFNIDHNYKGDNSNYPLQHHAYLYNVDGVVFSGCQFLNQDTNALDKGIGEGIHTINAGFSVSPYTPPGSMYGSPPMYPRFCGFVNGISVAGTGYLDPVVSIYKAFFDSVGAGVYIGADCNVATVGCNFKVGNGVTVGYLPVNANNDACDQNIGIYTKESPQFYIHDNIFMGRPNSSSTWYNYGTVVDNSGTYTNVIYNNAYDSLTVGVFALGINQKIPDIDPPFGLLIQCNQFANSSTDIDVQPFGTIYTPFDQGICTYQGSMTSTGAGTSARNTFSGSSSNIVVGFGCVSVSYYYDTAASATERPNAISGGAPGEVGVGAVTASNTCPAGLGGGGSGTFAFLATGLSPGDLTYQEQLFSTNQSILQPAITTYSSLMDAGNQSALITMIDTATVQNLLFQELMSASPWLSKKVLMVAADYGLLSYSQFMTVLEQNPDNLHDVNFLYYQQHNDYYLTQNDINTLIQFSAHITRRTTLYDTMFAAQTNIDMAGNAIISALKTPVAPPGSTLCTDSNSVYYLSYPNIQYQGLGNVGQWLQNLGGMWTYYASMGFYNGMGQYSTVSNLLNGLDSAVTSYNADTVERNTYRKLFNVLLEAGQAGRGITQLTDSEIALLDTTSIPVITHNTAEMEIISITSAINGLHNVSFIGFLPCVHNFFLHKQSPPKGHGHIKQYPNVVTGTVSDNYSDIFTVSPNPTSGTVRFTYNVQQPTQSGITITVTNVLGEKVFDGQTPVNAGSVQWNTEVIPAGIYVYQASDSKGVIARGKLLVVR